LRVIRGGSLSERLSFSCNAVANNQEVMPPSQACCNHDHDCDEADCAPGYSLYKHIDIPKVRSSAALPGGALDRCV
jgi:hypothetical protein